MEKIQLELPGFPGYMVCNDGTIVSKRSGLPLKARPKSEKHKTLCVTIRDSTLSVAAEVAGAFLEPRPDGHILGYLDGNSLNCSSSNLYWKPTQQTEAGAIQMSARHLRRLRNDR